MNKTLLLLISALTLSVSLGINATAIDNLYTAQVAVADNSNASRNSAIGQLLHRVLIKVSGQSNIAQHPKIKQSLTNALSFATEFSFNQVNGETVLVVNFNESVVDKLLKDNGFTLWDVRRPTVMLWLAFEEANGERHILNTQSNPLLVQAAQQAASHRGLPLLLPLWDLEDQLNVEVTDIWGLFEQKVAVANARYLSDYMIVGKVSRAEMTQQVVWSVFKMAATIEGYEYTSHPLSMAGSDEAVSIDDALAVIVSQSSDYFAAQYSVDTSATQGDLVLTITHVNTLADYASILSYLDSIKAVNEVVLIEVNGDTYKFKIDLLGNQTAFLDVISLEQRLTKTEKIDTNPVSYRWQG